MALRLPNPVRPFPRRESAASRRLADGNCVRQHVVRAYKFRLRDNPELVGEGVVPVQSARSTRT